MKKILLGVLILFTILTFSNYASAQVYIRQIGDYCMDLPNGVDTTLLALSFNIMSNSYCSIQGCGYFDQDVAFTGGSFWLEVGSTNYDWLSEVDLDSANAADLTVPFHTAMGLYFTRGSYTVYLMGYGRGGSDQVCRYSLIVTCSNRGSITTDYD
jgi:hypothetical protein